MHIVKAENRILTNKESCFIHRESRPPWAKRSEQEEKDRRNSEQFREILAMSDPDKQAMRFLQLLGEQGKTKFEMHVKEKVLSKFIFEVLTRI